MSGQEHRQEVDQLRLDAEARYWEMGFSSMHVVDEPDKVYEPHSHHEVRLFGLGGSSRISVGEGFINLARGVEVHIGEGIEHAAIAGPEGAEYLFAHPDDVDPFSSEA